MLVGLVIEAVGQLLVVLAFAHVDRLTAGAPAQTSDRPARCIRAAAAAPMVRINFREEGISR